MIAYASRTGTRRNLQALREAGWRLLVSAAGVWRTEGFPYAADNGAWADFQAGKAFDHERFERFLKWCAGNDAKPDWIILPDVVMGGAQSLELSLTYLRKLRRRKAWRHQRFLIAVQNGMDEPRQFERIRQRLGPLVGIFIGGDTDWKLGTMPAWARLARDRGAICHVGRVNTVRRIRLCEAAGVHSFDGSGASRYAVTVRPLELARQQTDLEGYLARAA